MMISQDDLFQKYELDQTLYKKAEQHWPELEAIWQDYCDVQEELVPHARMVGDLLSSVIGVHSVKSRLKDPEHLVAKIISKTNIEAVNRNNYGQVITDLIGLRALHLFKDDWIEIHNYIKNQWKIRKKTT